MTVACPGRETENIEREPLASWWAERIALALRRVRCCFDACPGHNHPSLNTNLRNYARDRYGTGLSQPVAGRDHLLPDTHSKKYRNDAYTGTVQIFPLKRHNPRAAIDEQQQGRKGYSVVSQMGPRL